MLHTFFILILLTLIIDSLGWIRFLWFISIGYGASIAGISIVLGVMYCATLTPATALLIVLGIIYGVRLSGYLLYRELKSGNYRKAISYDAQQSADYPLIARISIWLSCVLLYICQTTPMIVRLVNESTASAVDFKSDVALWTGIIVAALGLLLETLADRQKSKAKRIAPQRYVSTGLYRIVRCPNYFGEILFWTGILISGLTTFGAWWQWTLAIIGYVAIVYIMFSGARRLELRQDHNYGEDKTYMTYVANTPILLPFVPIYSVKRFTWLRG